MPLHDELSAYKTESRSKLPPEIRDIMVQGVLDIRASGIEDRALKTGEIAPDFSLPDATGTVVHSTDLRRDGPLIVVFYRGAWCPYCNLQLHAYQQMLPQLRAVGASLAAISPQLPDGSLNAVQKGKLEFPVLSDAGAGVARAFGVAYPVPPAVQALMQKGGNDLAVRNGSAEWILPIPATFVVAPDGRILLAHVDSDYTLRMEPDQVLARVTAFRASA